MTIFFTAEENHVNGRISSSYQIRHADVVMLPAVYSLRSYHYWKTTGKTIWNPLFEDV